MKLWNLSAAALLGGSLALAQQAQTPQVLFSGPPPAAKSASADAVHAPRITDRERRAVAITAWNLDVHLDPSKASLEVRAQVTLRNAGSAPLAEIPLQLSSTLHFDDADIGGTRLPFTTTSLPSDADHTGTLQEAAFVLPHPLAPRARITLNIDYGGTIRLSDQRLTDLGAPESQAAASDWDRISPSFTGLRGFGDVVWYPVSSVPAKLGDGAKLFREIGRQKLMDQNATMAMRVTDEFRGQPPNLALLDGSWIRLKKPAVMPTTAYSGILTFSLPPTPLGFEAPSLFLARRTETDSAGIRVLATPADQAEAQNYITAATRVAPLVQRWLGQKPRHLFTVLDLPGANDAPAETGNLLAIPIGAGDAASLAPLVAHGLAHAAFWSPRAWLNNGVASFIGTVWIQSADGRNIALESLNDNRSALALAEPALPGDGHGQNLLHAETAVYYRTKATYVLWMLRNLVGETALQHALQAYNPALDTTPDYFEHLLESASRKNLSWFFDDWVYHDRGLPDLAIGGIYYTNEAHDSKLVAVDIVNNGYAAASVPVTVKGANTADTVQVQVPAHGSITHRVIFQETPTEVDVNDGSVPEVRASVHVKKIINRPAGGPIGSGQF